MKCVSAQRDFDEEVPTSDKREPNHDPRESGGWRTWSEDLATSFYTRNVEMPDVFLLAGHHIEQVEPVHDWEVGCARRKISWRLRAGGDVGWQ